MQKYLAVAAIAFLLLFGGCKQDFDITADYKEIPVVYGLLNQQDSKHYIRIQKAYLIDGDAKLATGVTDSIYYPDVLTVKLMVYNTLLNDKLVDSINLIRVDENMFPGIEKDSGLFANVPNYLYLVDTTKTLNTDRSYQLVVTNNSNGYKFSSKLSNGKGVLLIKDFTISVPSKASKINLQNLNPARVVWTTAENAGIYDLTVRFPYKEYRTSDNSLLRDTFIDIVMFRSLEYAYTGSSVNPPFEITSDNLLGYLARYIPASTDVYREFNVQKGMQFKFAAGGTDLTQYLNSQRAQGGLASNEALAPYTNIDGGVGLLSSRYFKQVDSVLLTPIALDSLACSDITNALRFKNHNGVLCN